MRPGHRNRFDVFLFFGVIAFDAVEDIIYSVYSTFNCLPGPHQMYLDDFDFDGLLWWYKGCEKLSEEIKKQTKKKS